MRFSDKINELYEEIFCKELSELNAEGVYLRHRKTGARIALMLCDDTNKVFSIAFRTTPENGTGVAHILEHSVLCGSDKYPIKDPFVELAKGSLNTFLNAMTYPDKTVYPVASVNDKDFDNLMDVYLDSVFHPNIYKYKEIFLQEGWRYELTDGELRENGVVYNEMKGAYSDPSDCFFEAAKDALYPDTQYANDSGGDPNVIPELSYEEFLKFHGTLYHPSNSYIYLYGNVDAEEKLLYLDREYLSKYDHKEVDSNLRFQAPVTADVTDTYAVATKEEEENASWYGYLVSTDKKDTLTLAAISILDYVLSDAPGAPIKKALIDAGIGDDMSGMTETDIKQPMTGYMVRNAGADKKEEFVRIIEETLEKLVKEGIDKKSILAAINIADFRYREADFGAYPKGLIYNLSMFKSWLYDDNRPFDVIEEGKAYEELRSKIDEGYFEKLIDELILHNPHKVVVSLHPEAGKVEKNEAALKEKLQKKLDAMTEAEKQKIITENEELKKYQESGDTKEDLAKLPVLKREDIGKDPEPIILEESQIGGVKELKHDIFTNGITILRLMFDAKHITAEELKLLGLLEVALGYVDTKNYTYDDLAKEINLYTGGISPMLAFNTHTQTNELRVDMQLQGRCLAGKEEKMIELTEEIIFNSSFASEKRLKEILAETVSRMKIGLESRGHVTAVTRAAATISEEYAWQDETEGIAALKYLSDYLDNFEEKKAEIREGLESLMGHIFTKENLLISITSDSEGIKNTEKALQGLIGKLPEKQTEPELIVKRDKINEAFTTAGQVQYNAIAGLYNKNGQEYTGVMKVVRTMMNYDYLWMNLRVKGGAYGCMSRFEQAGGVAFISYRDPKLSETYDTYMNTPQYLESYTGDEEQMTKYIIGTMSIVDRPLSPSAKGGRADNLYIRGVSYEDLMRDRKEILTCNATDVNALANCVRTAFEDGVKVTIGNAGSINDNKELFDKVEALV